MIEILNMFLTLFNSKTLTLMPTAWKNSRNVLGCNEAFVWTVNHFVEAGPSRKQYRLLLLLLLLLLLHHAVTLLLHYATAAPQLNTPPVAVVISQLG